MDTKQILEKKQKGDIKLVAEILDVSDENARKILNRPNAKMHKRAITALEKIIIDRERTLQEAKLQQEELINS